MYDIPMLCRACKAERVGTSPAWPELHLVMCRTCYELAMDPLGLLEASSSAESSGPSAPGSSPLTAEEEALKRDSF